MMEEYNDPQQSYPFVRKTLSILKQYNGPLDVTLRLNCLIGLLIVPQQYSLEPHPLHPEPLLILDESWGIDIPSIDYGHNSKGAYGCKNNAHTIAKHIRNALCHHNRLSIKSDTGQEITHVIFKDYSCENENPNTKTFECRMHVDELYKFAVKYSTWFLAQQA